MCIIGACIKITKMWFLIDILGGLGKWLFWGPTAYPHNGQVKLLYTSRNLKSQSETYQALSNHERAKKNTDQLSKTF